MTSTNSILWLENDAPTIARAASHLEEHGYVVEVQVSISGFLQKLEERKYRYAIIDLHITDVENGTIIIEILKKNYPYISVIVFSSLTIDKSEAGVTYLRKSSSRLAPRRDQNNDLLQAIEEQSEARLPRIAPSWWSTWELAAKIAPTLQTRLLAIGGLLYMSLLIADATSHYAVVDQVLSAVTRMWMTTIAGIICLLLYYFRAPPQIRGLKSFSEFYSSKRQLYLDDKAYRDEILASESVQGASVDRSAAFDVLYKYYTSQQTSEVSWSIAYYAGSALYAGIFLCEFAVALVAYITYASCG